MGHISTAFCLNVYCAVIYNTLCFCLVYAATWAAIWPQNGVVLGSRWSIVLFALAISIFKGSSRGITIQSIPNGLASEICKLFHKTIRVSAKFAPKYTFAQSLDNINSRLCFRPTKVITWCCRTSSGFSPSPFLVQMRTRKYGLVPETIILGVATMFDAIFAKWAVDLPKLLHAIALSI